MDGSPNNDPATGQQGTWKYSSDTGTDGKPASSPATPHKPAPDEVSWSASEFIAHQKGVGWYLLLMLAALAAAGVVYLITHDVITCAIIIIVAILFAVSASHKPRVLDYRLDQNGLTVGRRFYPYGGFKAFTIVDEGSFSNITFVPLKRFVPGLSIYYAPEDEEKIIYALAAHLPLEQVSHDTFDRFMRRVRF